MENKKVKTIEWSTKQFNDLMERYNNNLFEVKKNINEWNNILTYWCKEMDFNVEVKYCNEIRENCRINYKTKNLM